MMPLRIGKIKKIKLYYENKNKAKLIILCEKEKIIFSEYYYVSYKNVDLLNRANNLEKLLEPKETLQ